jgi:hypothetical protein
MLLFRAVGRCRMKGRELRIVYQQSNRNIENKLPERVKNGTFESDQS